MGSDLATLPGIVIDLPTSLANVRSGFFRDSALSSGINLDRDA